MTKFFASLFLLSIVACARSGAKEEANSTKQQPIKDWKTLDQAICSIQYPGTWDKDESGQMGTSFFILSPVESTEDKFRENVNLLIQDLTGKNIDLNKYTDISENQIKTLAVNSNLVESKRIKNAGEEYQKVIYSADQGGAHLKFEQYFFIVKEKAYVLTFSSELNKFDQYKEVAEKILNSFQLKK